RHIGRQNGGTVVRLPALSALGRNHVFAALAVVLTLVAGWPWFAPVAEPTSPPDNRATSPSRPAVAALPAFTAFSGVVDRPLFSRSRRAAPRENAQAEASGIGSRYRLIGVVNAGDTRRVWLTDGTRDFQIGENEAV